MRTTETIIIGAGQAGMALSRRLTDAGRDHVVLERGRLGERWRSERWDSLRLLTPNWMTRLPGWAYSGADHDGFMTVPELVSFFDAYAASFSCPIQQETTVTSVRLDAQGYRVETDQGSWSSTNVVIATGVEGRPHVPSVERALSPSIHQVVATRYRNPQSLPPGGVLVVGASASGAQLADELARSGRDVVLSVGGHTRMPRRYRGLDVFWWFEQAGLFDTTVDELPDRRSGASAPSLQLVGRTSHERIDLATLQERGVGLTGRLDHIDGTTVAFRDDLASSISASELRMRRTLGQFDDLVERGEVDAGMGPADPPPTVPVPTSPTAIDLADRGIGTVLWATGFRRSYPWLHVPVLDGTGEIRQRRGVTEAPGLYVLGLRFQHHRNSNFIDGVGRDAAYLARHIATSGRANHEVAA
jgi:putative flavoprotein involved in K+ transport